MPATKQVSSGMGIGAAIGIVSVWIIESLGIEVPAEVAVAIGVLCVGIVNRIVRRFG